VAVGGGLINATYLGKYQPLLDKFVQHRDSGKWFAAICASPQLVLDANHLIDDYKATSFPKFPLEHCTRVDERVVVDKNLVTSRSPGTAMEFALKLIEVLYGVDKSKEIAGFVLAKE
jgi:4-methyl-5(b-hydroxyethyl)-thiazole monophosphate biosynthesis